MAVALPASEFRDSSDSVRRRLPASSILRLVVPLLLAYYALSLSLFAVWQSHGWYPITGDEPHYLIMTRGLLKHGSLETSQAYRDEFNQPNIVPGGLQPAGTTPNAGNSHGRQGPHGLFSVHGLGLPFMLAPSFTVDGVSGAKIFLVLLSGAAIIAAALLAREYIVQPAMRYLAVLMACFGVPLVIASNQVFPDLPGGIILLVALTWLALRRNASHSLWQDGTIALLLGFVPWLHIKFVLAAAFAMAGLVYQVLHERPSKWKMLALAALFCTPIALLALYNHYAFGRFTGPYNNGTEQFNSTTLMVFLGLHLDRMQGIWLQSPAMLAGLLFLAPFLRSKPAVAIPLVGCYLAVMVPNAAHWNVYGGASFGGRFAWTGFCVFLPATIYGIGRLHRLSPRLAYASSALCFALQAGFFYKTFDVEQHLYNQGRDTWWDVYHSLYPQAVWRFLPAFYDPTWAFDFLINYVYVLGAVLLVITGALFASRNSDRIAPTGVALCLVAGVAVVGFGIFAAQPPRRPHVYRAAALAHTAGQAQGTNITARAGQVRPGILTFGPYLELGEGEYRFELEYESDAPAEVEVGAWDLTANGGRIKLANGSLPGTGDSTGRIEHSFRVSQALDGQRFEIRTYFAGKADLVIERLTIHPEQP